MLTEKKCSRCNKIKPVDQFRKEPRNRSGINSRCKSCDVQASKQWNDRNPDKVKKHKQVHAENGIIQGIHTVLWRHAREY